MIKQAEFTNQFAATPPRILRTLLTPSRQRSQLSVDVVDIRLSRNPAPQMRPRNSGSYYTGKYYEY